MLHSPVKMPGFVKSHISVKLHNIKLNFKDSNKKKTVPESVPGVFGRVLYSCSVPH